VHSDDQRQQQQTLLDLTEARLGDVVGQVMSLAATRTPFAARVNSINGILLSDNNII
jgi:hypothetical protein